MQHGERRKRRPLAIAIATAVIIAALLAVSASGETASRSGRAAAGAGSDAKGHRHRHRHRHHHHHRRRHKCRRARHRNHIRRGFTPTPPRCPRDNSPDIVRAHPGRHLGSQDGTGPYPAPPRRPIDGEGDPGEEEGTQAPAGPYVAHPNVPLDPAPPVTEEPGSKGPNTGAPIGDIAVARNKSLRQSGIAGWQDTDGGESSVATDGRVVLLTSNDRDAISSDGGRTFTPIDAATVFPTLAGGYCCDQVVTYVPTINRFVWVLQYWSGGGGNPDNAKSNALRIATATPAQIVSSGAQSWTRYTLTPAQLGVTTKCGKADNLPFLDRSHIAFTQQNLYLTVNGFKSKKCEGEDKKFLGTAIARFPLSQLGGTLNMSLVNFDASDIPSKIRPAQGAFDGNLSSAPTTQWFAAEASTSRLDVISWPDGYGGLQVNELDVPSIAAYDTGSKDPAGANWMERIGKSAGGVETGALVGNSLVFGWMAGRQAKVATKDGTKMVDVHDEPSLDFVLINSDVTPIKRISGWDVELSGGLAAALPQLRANTLGSLALSFEYGGPSLYPSYGVAFLNEWGTAASAIGQRTSLVDTVGNDYVGLATDPSQPRCFVATGSASKTGVAGNPFVPNDYEDLHYVLFGRSSAGCAPPQPPPGPDLIVDSINGVPGSIDVVVRNIGPGAAGPSQLAYILDGGAKSFLDTPALGPGVAATVSIPCPRPGQIAVTAIADGTDAVAESNEGNNQLDGTAVCTAEKPDLVVTAVRVTGTGASGTISADVKNIGLADAVASQTRITQTGGVSTLVNTPALAPGASVTVSTGCGDGEDSATVVADATNVVDESDETNNQRFGSGSCFVEPH